jgi:hypothetical protein
MSYTRIIVMALCLVVFCSGTIWAQGTAQISGTAKDQSGALLPGVEVTVTQTETGITRSTVSNETGSYALPNLPVGPYRLEANLSGFRTYVQTGIVLQVNSSPVVNAVLQVGQVSEQIEVRANAGQVETRSAGVGQVVETQRILDLPLNGRQVTDLITLSGGAVQIAVGGAGQGMRTGVRISAAGGQEFGVQYSLDGATHLNAFDGTNLPLPFPDALQEFKFSTSTQDASNGMHSGAAVNAVTKSGTNDFHGDLFEFVRNNAFNARDFFATKNDGLKRNQFGGTIGGPILKNKMFFFAGYQGTTIRQTPNNNVTFVPTAQMLAGDFTAFASPACNGGRQITLRAPFVNNMVDPSLLSPAALKISARLPRALNACGTVLTGNIVHENDHQIPLRVDYQVSSKQNVFARYMWTKNEIAVPYALNPADVLTAGGVGADDQSHSLTLGQTYLVGANIVNSLRLSGNRVRGFHPGAQMFGAQDVGIKAYTYTPKYLTIPVSGGFSLGSGIFAENSLVYGTGIGVNDDLSIVKGSHQFAIGGSFMHSISYWYEYAFATGSYAVNGAVTGSGMSDFLLGNVSSFRQANPLESDLYQEFVGLYAQDTWKITPRLTINYGFRWEPTLPMTFRRGDVYNFSLARFYAGQRSNVVPTAPPGFTYPGDPGFNGNSGAPARWRILDPRVGLAWDPKGDGRTAVRIGGGIAHDFVRQDIHANTSLVQPFRLQVLQQGISLDDPWKGYPGGNPFPYVYNKNTPPAFVPYGSYLPIPPDLNNTVQYSWNFGIQRQMTPELFVSGAYIGTHLIHLWAQRELNPPRFMGLGPCTLNSAGGPVSYPVCSTAANINQRRVLNLANPAANLGYITQYDDGGTQGYNGMLLDIRWRRGQNFNVNANYTWSHCIGLPTTSTLNPGQNYLHQADQNNGPDNRNLDVGDCYLADRRQIFNATAVARTPKFANTVLRYVASDWSFSTIYQQRSGQPLTVILGTDQALNGFGTTSPSVLNAQRPNQILANPYGDRHSLTNYLNPAAFAIPALGTYGNVGQSTIVGPGFWEWDEAISREFQVGEQKRLEFRAEAFNVTNSLRPGNPNVILTAPNTFGRILCSAANNNTNGAGGCSTTAQAFGGPRIMQFALKYFF